MKAEGALQQEGYRGEQKVQRPKFEKTERRRLQQDRIRANLQEK